jgi:hypothetical protein
MQEPTNEAEASIPTENAGDDPDLNPTFAACRKAAKRTRPWDLAVEELELVSSQPPQDEDIPATKKRRLEESISASTDEAAAKISSVDTAVRLPAAAEHADAVPVRSTQARRYWTPEEDTKLTSALANTCNMKRTSINWVAVAALIPGRTNSQCRDRWRTSLDPHIDQASGHKGIWTAVEDNKLNNAVQTHGANNWKEIAALVPGRTKRNCQDRWKKILDPSIGRANGRTGAWSEDEDSTLKDAVQTYGGKSWGAIAALVPGRTESQCLHRWRDALDPNIILASGSKGKWTADEDSKLKDAMQTHGHNNWVAVSVLVPGRTHKQCYQKWRDAWDLNIDRRTGRTVNGQKTKMAS